MPVGGFTNKYGFAANHQVIVLEYRSPSGNHEGKTLRVNPKNEGQADHNGGDGKFARWIIRKLRDNGNQVRLGSENNNGKYIRIKKDGNIDVLGGLGPLTVFNVIKKDNDIIQFESVSSPGKFLAVQPQGVAVGTGGKWCDFKAWRNGSTAAEFKQPYNFVISNSVVFQHKKGGNYNQYLRVNPDNLGQVGPNGATGFFAQWEVFIESGQGNGCQVRVRSEKSGKYLRIMNNKIDADGGTGPFTLFKVHLPNGTGSGPNGGTICKLESVKSPGQYISVQKSGEVAIGSGGPWTELNALRRHK